MEKEENKRRKRGKDSVEFLCSDQGQANIREGKEREWTRRGGEE